MNANIELQVRYLAFKKKSLNRNRLNRIFNILNQAIEILQFERLKCSYLLLVTISIEIS